MLTRRHILRSALFAPLLALLPSAWRPLRAAKATGLTLQELPKWRFYQHEIEFGRRGP